MKAVPAYSTLILGFFFIIQLVSCKQEVKINVDNNSWYTTASGLQILIVSEGNGLEAGLNDTVLIHETTKYSDSTLIFSSYEYGQPLRIGLGQNQIIEGLEEGIVGMKKGEKRKLIIPSVLSTRSSYPDHVHPDSTLYYDVELIEIFVKSEK